MKEISEEEIKDAIALISKSSSHEDYFFSKADSPSWLEPLRKQEIFRRPQRSIQEKEGTRFPSWPPARYLIHVATLKPEKVMDIILEAEETDNYTVHAAFLEAALLMPPIIARRIIPKIRQWKSTQYRYFYSEKIGYLIKNLTEGGFRNEGLALAKEILELRPKREISGKETGEDETYMPPPEAIGFIVEFDYKRVLSIALSPLLDHAPAATFKMLCELLEYGIQMSFRDNEAPDGNDYSYVWRESVAGDKRSYSQPFLNLIITSLRDAGVFIGQNRPELFHDTIQSVLEKKWPIFWRIGLYLISEFPDLSSHLLATCITSEKLFKSLPVRHEYYSLCLKHFRKLQEEEKQKVLNWIEAGPDTESYVRFVEGRNGSAPSVEAVEEYKKRWQRDRLSPLLGGVSPEWKKSYDEIVSKFGESFQPDYPTKMSAGWVGPTSPKSVDDLLSISVDEVAKFLKSWQPQRGHEEPSPEGLGRILEQAVGKSPLEFARSANLFIGLDPTYVRQIVSGFASATQKNIKLPWERVFELVDDVLSRPRSILNRQTELGDADPDWGWTRKSIASLIGYSLAPSYEMPLALRKQIWTFISKLVDDPEPDAAYEMQYGGSNMDPATLSINTTRGEAMHTVVKYALWCKKSLAKDTSRPEGEIGLKDIPEARDVLETHLNITTEPTLTIRSVYGQWFPSLVWLDREWASEYAMMIFPTEASEKARFEAAWYTYISFCTPYHDVFKILQPQYSHAIDCLKGAAVENYGLIHDPNQKLAEHLMIYYWIGKLGPSDSLLVSFFENASDSLRASSIRFIGSSLSEESVNEVPSEVLERLIGLLMWRLSSIPNLPTGNDELLEFGWWVASRKFNKEWWLPTLLQILKRCKGVEWDHEVVKVLSEARQSHLREVIECVDLMIRGERDSWSGMMWKESLMEMLRSGLESSDANIMKQSVDLINYLGAKGYNEYRSLLRSMKNKTLDP